VALSWESGREFGGEADDCVSSGAVARTGEEATTASWRERSRSGSWPVPSLR